MHKDDFDKNSMDRIYNLLVLKGKCLNYNRILISSASDSHHIDAQTPLSTFFSSMSDVIDIFIINFINEEVSASRQEREPLCAIIDHIKCMCKTTDHEWYLAISTRDCIDLFSKRIDFYIGSSFVDFSVSTYSAFEFWVCKLYSDLKREKGSSGSKVRSIKKIIEENIGMGRIESTAIEQAATEIVGKYMSYISGSEKIDFVMSCAKQNYRRDIKHDSETIYFCRNMRNSIHNLGTHEGNNITIDGGDYGKASLSTGNPAYCENFSINISLCADIVEIYNEIISSIGIGKIGIDRLMQISTQSG